MLLLQTGMAESDSARSNKSFCHIQWWQSLYFTRTILEHRLKLILIGIILQKNLERCFKLIIMNWIDFTENFRTSFEINTLIGIETFHDRTNFRTSFEIMNWIDFTKFLFRMMFKIISKVSLILQDCRQLMEGIYKLIG